MQFDVLLQLRRLVGALVGKLVIAPASGQFREALQHVVEEERQPHALALAFLADEVHAVVPVAAADQRQPVRAESQSVFDRPHAVLVERAVFPRALRQIVVRFLVGIHRAAFEERHALVEHAGVAGHLHIPAGRVRQPEVIVGAMRAHAAAGGRMPPVLHVAFAELAAGAPQQMLAGGPRRGVEQRRRVLELVAEPVRAAGLVVPAPSPVATGQRLVLQPAVDQQVQGGVRRLGVHDAQRPFPEFPDALQGQPRAGRAAEPPDQLLGLVGIVAGAQHEDQFALLAVGQVERHLQRRAGVEARARLAGQLRVPHRGGIGRRAVASQKLRAAAGDGPRGVADVDEDGLAGKLTVVHVAGKQRARGRVDLGDHVHQVRVPPLAEHQLPVAGDRQAPGPARAIAHLHHHQFHGRVQRDVGPQFRADPQLRVLKHAVAESVSADVGAVPARGQRRRRPELTGFLVADVKRLAAGVAHRIVVPGGEPEFVGVVHPGVGPAAFRDHRADLGVGQHVRPRRGRGLTRRERDHVLASVGREPAQTVEEDAFARGRRGGCRPAGVDRVGTKRGILRSTGACRSTCSARVSALSVRITRATVCSRTRSSSDNCSLRRRKIPPGLSTRCASVPAAIKPRMRSCKT